MCHSFHLNLALIGWVKLSLFWTCVVLVVWKMLFIIKSCYIVVFMYAWFRLFFLYMLFGLIDWGFSLYRQYFSHLKAVAVTKIWPFFEFWSFPGGLLFFEIQRNGLLLFCIGILFLLIPLKFLGNSKISLEFAKADPAPAQRARAPLFENF